MANLRQWIEEVAEGEAVEAVVLGEMGWGGYGKEAVPTYEDAPKGEILTWEQAAPFLDYDFDEGFGAPGCQAIYCWTASKVILIGQYDGSTFPVTVPRNPTATMPEMPGG